MGKVNNLMEYSFYQEQFALAVSKIDRSSFDKLNLKLYVGVVLNSVVVKVYKTEWSNDKQNPLTAESRIFFSIWVNEKTIAENKLYYNIHALKLRKFPGYKIASRGFAERFRKLFSTQMNDWPNVDIKYGPLTLMEGWVNLNTDTIQKDILSLLKTFLKTSPLIDKTLSEFKAII